MSFTVKVSCPRCDGEIEVEIKKYSTGRTARISGPPETCYPAEPAEIEDYETVSTECEPDCYEKDLDKLFTLIYEKFAEELEDYEESLYDAWADAEYNRRRDEGEYD